MARGVGSYQSGGSQRQLIPIGKGGLANGLMVNVVVPRYFSEISQRRSGWKNPWEEIERVLVVANQKMAESLQLMTMEELEEGRIGSRRQYSTGRLEASIASAENVVNTGRRWGLGNRTWLDGASPASLYWRQIEAGSNVHVGREVHGLFFDGRNFFSANPARRSLDELMTTNSAKFVIKRPIEGQWYYRNAWRRFNPASQSRAALQAAIEEVLGVTFRSKNPQWRTLIGSL